MPPLPAAARFSDRTLLRLPLGLLLAGGCGGSETSSPLAWELDDGRTLAEWIAGEEAAAVLVMDPDECL